MMTFQRTAVLCGLPLLALLLTALSAQKWSRQTEQSPFVPSPIDLQVIGQDRWLAGSRVSFRLACLDRLSQSPLPAQVSIRLERLGKIDLLFEGSTDRSGSLSASWKVPEKVGSYRLIVEANTPRGKEEFSREIQVVEAGQILLTTDKPLYQPGQTVHIRALALSRANQSALAGRKIIFEIYDPKGNKVLKEEATTSDFGIAAGAFPLADEVTLGTYRVTAVIPSLDQKSPSPIASAEKTFNVQRYVLPKFQVKVETDKTYYLPGQTISGRVQADYFFGKPVAKGTVEVALATFAAGWHPIGELKGRLDDKGFWTFETRLPETLVGLPLEGGKALVKLEVTVTDSAKQEERSVITLPVSSQPIEVAVVPESRSLKPQIPMRLFVVTTYPDGSPASCRFDLTIFGLDGTKEVFRGKGQTDKTGIGEVTVTIPASAIVDAGGGAPPFGRRRQVAIRVRPGFGEGDWGPSLTIRGQAVDDKGSVAKYERNLPLSAQPDQVLLRLDKAVAKVGDTINCQILARSAKGNNQPVFLDAIVNRQTILTRTIDLQGGRGSLSITVTPDMVGTLLLHAYRITPEGDFIRDTKLVIVEPADSLQITVQTDKNQYRPGEEASLSFQVKDQKGKPVRAAIGFQIVDESLFALAEAQPGLERLYFLLEEELLKPRYEVHGWELRPILLRRETEPAPAVQRAAQVLLAAMAPEPSYSLRASTYQEKLQKVQQVWQEHLGTAANKIRKAFETYRRLKGHYPGATDPLPELVRARLLSPADIRDPLGIPYGIEMMGSHWGEGFRLISGGIDRKRGSDDDWVAFVRRGVPVEVWRLHDAIFADGPVFARRVAPLGPVGQVGAAGPPGIALAEATAVAGEQGPGAQPVRIRQFFPETLLVIPQLITDRDGRATMKVALADSITTWRLTATANSRSGLLGSTTAPIRVFQDFFVDLDLPRVLTEGDEVEIPAALYNYLAKPQRVRLKLEVPQGLDLLSAAQPVVSLEPNEVSSVSFRIKASRHGHYPLTLFAYGEVMSDAVKRTIEVVPDGKEIMSSVSDQMVAEDQKSVVKRVTLKVPDAAIDGASRIWVKVYPGAFSQVMDGLENLLRMPFGCFEQTSSVTYPNVLILDYLRKTGQAQPETEMKARHFITIGYQRLLTFEVPGGGFSWFGDPPAHKVLTAYGLLQFSDMGRVHNVDENLIARTGQWLISQQKKDGSWEPDRHGIAEGAINRQSDILRTTAYIAWALSSAAKQFGQSTNWAPAIGQSLSFLSRERKGAQDPYALAVLLNAAAGAYELDKKESAKELADWAAERLVNLAKQTEEEAFWVTKETTPFYGAGETGDLETTGLAAFGLLRHGRHLHLATKALTYLIRRKDNFGTWQTTQATIWSLKAFLAAATGKGTIGDLKVLVNGQPVAQWQLNEKTGDMLLQADAQSATREGANEVTLEFKGKGSFLFQAVARFYLPWALVPPPEEEPLDISVRYDRTEVLTKETVICQVRLTNRTPAAAKMVLVDIGLPPGFDPVTEDLSALVEQKKIQRYERTHRQIIFYIEEIGAKATITWEFRLRARYPVRAKTAPSTAYPYYEPTRKTQSRPFLVRSRWAAGT
ncbi:MAG: MG2 domain-containing protein [Armatimonadetes bacterium]|nr:MG2 domain-containing protein [Armatimonadota bacterium]MDW8120830.1 MG2 domain-containing protein [Armatimonadota bacterium]